MATNTLLTTSAITREALRLLHEKLTFVRSINRQYDDSFARQGAKIGDTLRIRMPSQYVASNGAALVKQDSIQQSVSLQVSTRKHVGMEFTTQELTMSMDKLRELHLEPAMATLAAAIEADCIQRATLATFNATGSWGTPPTTLEPFLGARAKLNQFLAPKDSNRHVLLSSMQGVKLVDGLKSLTNDEGEISKQYREGYITRAAGLNWAESESVHAHTNGDQTMTGTVSTTVSVNGTDQIVMAGLGNSKSIKAGTVFAITGVYALHPETKAQRQELQQFVVTADATSHSSNGTATLTVSPAMYYSADGRQNISKAPTASDVVTYMGTLSQSKEQALVYHRDAFTFATADLILPRGAVEKHREVYDGISLRFVEGYDIDDDLCPSRFDVLYGFAALRPQHSCRVTS